MTLQDRRRRVPGQGRPHDARGAEDRSVRCAAIPQAVLTGSINVRPSRWGRTQHDPARGSAVGRHINISPWAERVQPSADHDGPRDVCPAEPSWHDCLTRSAAAVTAVSVAPQLRAPEGASQARDRPPEEEALWQPCPSPVRAPVCGASWATTACSRGGAACRCAIRAEARVHHRGGSPRGTVGVIRRLGDGGGDSARPRASRSAPRTVPSASCSQADDGRPQSRDRDAGEDQGALGRQNAGGGRHHG